MFILCRYKVRARCLEGFIYASSPFKGETWTGHTNQDGVCVVPVARGRMFRMGDVVHSGISMVRLARGARERGSHGPIAGGRLVDVSCRRWCWCWPAVHP